MNEEYVIYEHLGEREKTRGRFSKGYILGVKKTLVNSCQNVILSSETCSIDVKGHSRIIHIMFSYLSPKSTTSFVDAFALRDTANEFVIIADLNSRVGTFSLD
jgi:hypothetical protein